MTFPLRFSALAENDLNEIALWIAAEDPVGALRFIEGLRDHCQTVAKQPRAYPLREEYGIGIRITIHGSYLIFHAERDGAVFIERIIHGARHLPSALSFP